MRSHRRPPPTSMPPARKPAAGIGSLHPQGEKIDHRRDGLELHDATGTGVAALIAAVTSPWRKASPAGMPTCGSTSSPRAYGQPGPEDGDRLGAIRPPRSASSRPRWVIWASIWPAVPSWRRHYCPRSTNSSSSSTRSSPEPGFRCSPQDSTPGFELVDTQPLNSGVVILTYARARSRPPGSRPHFQLCASCVGPVTRSTARSRDREGGER